MLYASLQADVQRSLSIWKARLLKEDIAQRLRTALLARLSTVGLRLSSTYRFPVPREITREKKTYEMDYRGFVSTINDGGSKLCQCNQ